MKKRSVNHYAIAMAGFVLISACNSSNVSGQQGAANSPVETNKANSEYKPAFAGQTRIAGVKTTTPYKVEQMADGLYRPWAIAPMPDGRLLVTSISGYMTIHDANGTQLKKITGFPPVVAKAQGGLLDVALDPDFTANRTIYWSFSQQQGDSNLTAVAKGQVSADELTIENPVVIFRATPALKSSLHFGSRLIFDKDGYLFVSTGERSNLDGRKQSQWLNSGLGKVFKITKEGKPAPGNPFLNTAGAIPEIYSYGHRNPQSLDIHPVTGDLWEAEFGPRGGDELNRIVAGKNYGWPTITYGIEYGGGKVGDGIQQKDGMEQPVYYWDPVLSPGGMAFYPGDGIPEWKNNLFISGLSGMHICRLVIENNKVVGEERLLTDKQERFSDVAYVNCTLIAVTDRGKMFRISKQ